MPRVVITGASGNVGAKLREHLAGRPDWQLVLLDRGSQGTTDIIAADLSSYEPGWVELLTGADALVHLAAEADSRSPWPLVQRANIDGTINVLEACVEHRVPRLVFASSLTTMDGYRNTHGPLSADMTPRPQTFYAASKLFGERLCRNYTEHHGLSVVCLRFGIVRRGDNAPSPRASFWDQGKWLANGDVCQAIEKAVTVAGVRYSVLIVTSLNEGMRWDLAETRRVLGYEPQTRSTPVQQPPLARLRGWVGRWVRQRCARYSAG